MTPGADHRPGSGLNVYPVRPFVDLFNDRYGVTLSQADSGLFELGRRTTAEDPVEPVLHNSTVLALAMENTIDWNEAIRDQAGVRRLVYRYSIRGPAGGGGENQRPPPHPPSGLHLNHQGLRDRRRARGRRENLLIF